MKSKDPFEYVLDLRLVHIMDQRELRRGEGPIALVMVPTRELALQIYTETKRYCKVYNVEVMMKCFNLTFNNIFSHFLGGLRLWRR